MGLYQQPAVENHQEKWLEFEDRRSISCSPSAAKILACTGADTIHLPGKGSSRNPSNGISRPRMKAYFEASGLFCDIYSVMSGSLYISLRPQGEELFGVARISNHPPTRPIYLPTHLQPRFQARTWPHKSISLHEGPPNAALIIQRIENWLPSLWDWPRNRLK
jgi:hypothetical protein